MTCPQDHFSTHGFILTKSVPLTWSQYQKASLLGEQFTFLWWEFGGVFSISNQGNSSSALVQATILIFQRRSSLPSLFVLKHGMRLQWLNGSTQALCGFLLDGGPMPLSIPIPDNLYPLNFWGGPNELQTPTANHHRETMHTVVRGIDELV